MCQAKAGMTWAEWLDSDYNTAKDDSEVFSSNVIVSGMTYTESYDTPIV